MINGLRAPLFSDSFRGRKEVVPDTTTPLKWCRLSFVFCGFPTSIFIRVQIDIYIYITVQSIIFPLSSAGHSQSQDRKFWIRGSRMKMSVYVSNKLKLFGTFPKCWVKHKYGFVWKQGTEISVGYHHFPNRIATEYSSFSDTPELPICIWSSYGCTHSASSISSLAKLVATWQFACACVLCPDLSGCVWEWGSIPEEDWADPCFGNYASATMVLKPIIRNYASESMLRQPRRGTMFRKPLNPNPTGNHT